MATILLVDDEEFSRATTRKMLEEQGHSVLEASSGAQAMMDIRANAFDLVITDVIMPNMDGIELMIELRKLQPSLPVLAISGGGRTHNLDILDAAEQLGATSVLAKPFAQANLIEVVTRLLDAAA
jgi:CheY-like chemotaxis protein